MWRIDPATALAALLLTLGGAAAAQQAPAAPDAAPAPPLAAEPAPDAPIPPEPPASAAPAPPAPSRMPSDGRPQPPTFPASDASGAAEPPAAGVPTSPVPAQAPTGASGGPQSPPLAGDRPPSPADAVPTGGIAEALLPRDLSPWGMFMAADVVVKAVMIGLAFASLVTWTVWLAKTLEIAAARHRLRRGLAAILGAGDLEAAERALAGQRGPAALMVRAARHEAAASVATLHRTAGQGLLQRVTSHLSRIEAQSGRRLMLGTGVLATIGATAPFVGLFGTVWGIMNSFIGISESQTTNLAVVAPGIAEALLATALGLVAAIPAVVIYNVFARSIAGYRALLGDAGAAVERLVSRDLDHGRLGAAALPRAAE